MKDAIDKRNEKERIAKSIVKGWNVIYITKEELEKKRQEEERMQQAEEEREKADEILKRLEEEAQNDKKKKADEIEALLAQMELDSHKSSDSYGTIPMDGVTQEKVEAILSDKNQAIQQIIQNTEMDSIQQKLEEELGEESEADNTEAEEDSQTGIEEVEGDTDEEISEDVSVTLENIEVSE